MSSIVGRAAVGNIYPLRIGEVATEPQCDNLRIETAPGARAVTISCVA